MTRPITPRSRASFASICIPPPESFGGPNAALRGDQEIAGADHDVSRLQSLHDLVVVLAARAHRDLLRPESPFAEIDEDESTGARVENRFLRHDEPLAKIHRYRGVRGLTGAQREIG